MSSSQEGQEELKDRASEDELEDQAQAAEGGERSCFRYHSGIVPPIQAIY